MVDHKDKKAKDSVHEKNSASLTIDELQEVFDSFYEETIRHRPKQNVHREGMLMSYQQLCHDLKLASREKS